MDCSRISRANKSSSSASNNEDAECFNEGWATDFYTLILWPVRCARRSFHIHILCSCCCMLKECEKDTAIFFHSSTTINNRPTIHYERGGWCRFFIFLPLGQGRRPDMEWTGTHDAVSKAIFYGFGYLINSWREENRRRVLVVVVWQSSPVVVVVSECC